MAGAHRGSEILSVPYGKHAAGWPFCKGSVNKGLSNEQEDPFMATLAA